MGDQDGEEQQSATETPPKQSATETRPKGNWFTRLFRNCPCDDPPLTYDQRMNRNRERVTNSLAILIVLATVFAGLWSFNFVGEGDSKMEDAKALVAFMSGLSGAIIGYYFGRGPAEAHATRAQKQMDEMKENMGKVKGTIDTHIDRGESVGPEELRKVSEGLSASS
jgi:hypothetical protein